MWLIELAVDLFMVLAVAGVIGAYWLWRGVRRVVRALWRRANRGISFPVPSNDQWDHLPEAGGTALRPGERDTSEGKEAVL